MGPLWLLDDGPLETLARHIDLVHLDRWPSGAFSIADSTGAAADARRSRLSSSLDLKGRPLVSVFSVAADSPAAAIIYGHLRHREPSATANLAEHQCIAHALIEAPDAVFVTHDKRAAFLALYELGLGRVAHSMDLWDHFRRENLVDSEGFARLVDYTRRADQSLPGAPWRFRKGG